MNSIELTAPAKVNLVLKVLNKRKDSYHNLFTLFERISLADRIKISRIDKGIIVTCDRHVTDRPQDNIAYKAAELILKTAKADMGVKIHIKKRIPIAAGLGGGSSDAAAVLTGINKLFKLNISKDKLIRLGAKLGADVPFFMFDAPFAIGRGIGDRLEKSNLNTKLYHIIIYPGFKVATKDIYQALDLSRRLTNSHRDDRITLPKDWDGFEGLLRNDLETIVTAKRPVVGKVIRCLASSLLGRKAMVSGSGPSVFCLCRTGKEAIEVKNRLLNSVPERSRKRWQVFIAWTRM
ncbi:MAG: 4-(cytidine 5'-diphospho)-2-C-methyl-D-erythritol kinase [Candidatus Omnitrophica bacterium]|nr:4-(cytidine 5'-diphospho)-2-C-methyl-D-erythritol kinase [Candidatus Omnitrophota bacterium]